MNRRANPVTVPLAQYSPQHFLLGVSDGVATVTLNRPERKNPLTFESYRELTDFFRAASFDDDVKAVVVTGAGGNFEAEAVAQALCMTTADFERAFVAFSNKVKPAF